MALDVRVLIFGIEIRPTDPPSGVHEKDVFVALCLPV